MSYMTQHMGGFLFKQYSDRLMSSKCSCQGMGCFSYGNYLILVYLFIKVLYISNIVGQVFYLNEFLATDYHLYGIEVLQHMVVGEDWTISDRFPRVTFCDFKIRVLGNIQRYTVQCSLPLNLYNEKIFILIWFWFIFVGIVTLGSLMMWAVTTLVWPYQIRYIRSRLMAMDKLNEAPDELVKCFTCDYLRRDGLFIIQVGLWNFCK
jgi:hypothetical protein